MPSSLNTLAVRNFAIDVRKFAIDQSEQGLVKAHRALTLIALTRIVLRTPVDTGRARANWQVTRNIPAVGVVNYSPDTKNDSREKNEVRAKTISNVNAQQEIAKIKPFSIVFITNNVLYIEFLEKGSSKRSPKGMVAVTFQELINAKLGG